MVIWIIYKKNKIARLHRYYTDYTDFVDIEPKDILKGTMYVFLYTL